MTPDRFRKLKPSVTSSYDSDELKGFRADIKKIVQQYCGPHYGRGASKDSSPINLTELATTTYMQNLSSADPQALLLTDVPELVESCLELELALNKTLKKIKFRKEHELWVLSMLFGVGIMRIGLEVVDNPIVDGEPLPQTEIFCESIMFDDFVFDQEANKFDIKQLGYYGHRYSMNISKAKSNPEFDEEARQAISEKTQGGMDRVEAVSKGQQSKNDKFNEQCILWDIFIPETGEVVTFPAEGGHPDKPLKVVKSKRRCGPYLFHGFNPVLANVMPSSPASHWYDLSDLTGKLYNKVGEQASRQKKIGMAPPGAEQTAGQIMKSVDGDVLIVDNPRDFMEFSTGGVDQNTLAAAMNAKAMASYQMGNLDTLAGLATAAGTLGQEQMIRTSSSDRMRKMQTVVAMGTKDILREICFYLHTHPTVEMNLTRKIPNTNLELPISWPKQINEHGIEEDVRRGDFDTDYDIDIVPYSTVDMTPGERLQLLRTLWREDIIPCLQLGVQPDVPKYLQLIAKYSGMSELSSIVPAVSNLNQVDREAAPKAPATTRNYVRTSVRGGMSPAAAQQQAEMAMIGAGGSNNQPGAA